MTPRHPAPSQRAASGAPEIAGMFRIDPPLKRVRAGGGTPALRPSRAGHPFRLDRKGVTVVRQSTPPAPDHPIPTPPPDPSSGEALARWLTHHERYDVATLESERRPTPVESERRRRTLEQVPVTTGDEDAPPLAVVA